MSARTTTLLEPVFILNPHGFQYCEMEGTSAMLIEEGLIPDGTIWPSGYSDTRWQAGQFKFWLRKRRPAGTKGPLSGVDWFRIRWELNEESDRTALAIRQKTEELADTVRRLTPEGQAESHRRARRVVAAKSDASFQQFKAAVGIPTRQGRRKVTH
ncbi:hypothetical protein ACFPAG_08050 [Vogesella sp. GCM10023246]|uniref:Uncharacterized protein n=1 Tax=Vogesella oryzagri TaxID=3160864 RepID=A0ABV1M2W1_9NEIS